eukprot:scaffold102360_cov30-Phaeocystis_antarctica.AAC.1
MTSGEASHLARASSKATNRCASGSLARVASAWFMTSGEASHLARAISRAISRSCESPSRRAASREDGVRGMAGSARLGGRFAWKWRCLDGPPPPAAWPTPWLASSSPRWSPRAWPPRHLAASGSAACSHPSSPGEVGGGAESGGGGVR